MGQLYKIGTVRDLAPGEGKVIEVDRHEIALFNVEGTFYALNNICPHRGGPLGEGFLDEGIVTCPWHGWKFDVTTGISPLNPRAKVAQFLVKVEGEDLYVELPE